ncbi:serine carboxypeptidase S28-domain-containing protein [Schizophyllum amplum]|uniref:Serine carboxypeptidase S28-domain-containing protein n=1 Tax=Schizophyllum amplum TaxID=97359 RepID=A0A550CH98_9AGAR|nr:serine carboxypeptidase S28-domain-containing protein [Auriculariopsis ampla]
MLPQLLLALSLTLTGVASASFQLAHGYQEAKLRKLNAETGSYEQHQPVQTRQYEEFPEQWFEQPLDHFNNETGDTFLQRYWFSTRHYTPGAGGPVIVLDGGETSGEGRLPFLDTGIVEILTRATGGVGVILEHRYYGETQPVQNLTTDSLRFLNNEQSAADSAHFMANVKFDGIDEDLTAPGTPWIYYGGSYAGARAAHMRVLYPDLVYGAIASSGVTHAILEDWEYMNTIRKAAPANCSEGLQNSIQTIDSVLGEGGQAAEDLKALFGLQGLQHNDDFGSIIRNPIFEWQSKCWNSDCGSDAFNNFCEALVEAPLDGFGDAAYGDPRRSVNVTDSLKVDYVLQNYASYVNESYVAGRCPGNYTIEDCFGSYDASAYTATSLDQDWRLWQFQVCTQWGFFNVAPTDPDQPRIISSFITLETESKICDLAYPPGDYFTVPSQPNITAVNALGGYDITADRLAIIDGEVDPWRPDTPHSLDAKARAVHHYDEYGYADLTQEPPEIQQIHEEMIAFVTEWLNEWNMMKPAM